MLKMFAPSVLGLACAVTAALGQSPPPSTVYYGALSASEQTEVQAWGIAYWAKAEAGTPSTMTFSNAAMNSHLFNPFRGARGTLESLMTLGASDCDLAIIETDASTLDAATLAKR